MTPEQQQKDLRPINISPQLRAHQQQQHLWAPQTPPSPTKKVKLLCSFGGKILPRPSDCALRYVGGHTRIISVPKDIPFADLMARMADITGGGPVVFKYQLPNEDLDALISVSCAEDLDNMMDEYDKIAESAADGSAKIRVFLFSPADSSDAAGVGDLGDTGQRYFDAVNGVGGISESGGGSSVGSLKRKDSGLSAGSSNSGIEGVDGIGESPQTLNQGGGYLDPNQVQYLNTNVVNLAPLPAHVSMAAAPAAQVSNRVAQPLSQLPPLPPAYQNVEGFGMNQDMGVRLDDCHLCQKMLPHVHSDTLVQNVGRGSPGTETSPVFYSQRLDDAIRVRAPTSNLGDNVGEPKIGGQFGAYGYEGDRPFVQKVKNVDYASAFHPPPPGSMAFPPDALSSYGMFFGNFPQSRHEDPQVLQQQQLQQQQQQQQQQRQQQQWQNVVSPHYPARPEVTSRPVPVGNDIGSVRNAEGSPQYANEYVRPINGMMEGLHLNPTAATRYNVQGNAVVMPDGSPLVVDGTYSYMPQVGGNVLLPGRTFANTSVVQERNYVRPNDQMLPATVDHGHMHNFPAAEPGQVYTMAGNQGPFPHHLGVREPPLPSEGLLSMPPHTSGIDPAYSDRLVKQLPIGDLRDESSQLHFDHVAASQSGNVPFGLSNTTSPTGLVETFQEPSPTDSLFCNQDPRKILGGAHPLPPRPRRVSSGEAIALKDPGVQVHLGNSTESEIIALLEEGGLHPSPDSLNKDLRLDAIQQVKVSGDEQIKQDLQAVAEGVASSVLNSPLPPAPVFVAHDGREINTEFEDERRSNAESQRSDRKMEDNKPKAGLHITDDIGRLQIIKNSDLEELRELGSGTFGTVYHGKWRGTDVAIKRINDRCFAGKPSEQEKMRADFWNEACKLAGLHHPNVVAFYGVVLDGPGGSVATVTEFMVNGSLRTALQRNDKILDRRRRLLIAMDVAFGMEYLHGRNIVHFDLKSDNLLVNLRDPQRPICKVGDLGLSKVKCQTLISGGVRGTLPWMAPELLNGSSSLVSEKVDVFSFGIVMWELLTGEEPYADLHYGAIIGGIVSNTLRPPVPDSCDPEWRALMEKCWSADPSERPSFTEVAERLRSIAASHPQKGQAHAQVQK